MELTFEFTSLLPSARSVRSLPGQADGSPIVKHDSCQVCLGRCANVARAQGNGQDGTS